MPKEHHAQLVQRHARAARGGTRTGMVSSNADGRKRTNRNETSAAAAIFESSSLVLEKLDAMIETIALTAALLVAGAVPTMKATVTARIAKTIVTRMDLARGAAARYQCLHRHRTSMNTRANSSVEASTSWWRIR